MPERFGASDRLAHQGVPDAKAAMAVRDGERAEHQRIDAAGAHMPQPDRADENVADAYNERKLPRGLASHAKALAGLPEACRSERVVEQFFARDDGGRAP